MYLLNIILLPGPRIKLLQRLVVIPLYLNPGDKRHAITKVLLINQSYLTTDNSLFPQTFNPPLYCRDRQTYLLSNHITCQSAIFLHQVENFYIKLINLHTAFTACVSRLLPQLSVPLFINLHRPSYTEVSDNGSTAHAKRAVLPHFEAKHAARPHAEEQIRPIIGRQMGHTKLFSDRQDHPVHNSFLQTYHEQSLALNAGLEPDPCTQAISPNITMSVNHQFAPDSGAFSAAEIDDLTQTPYLYAGWTNPTVRQLEQRIAALERAEEAFATSSGMAALSNTFLSLLKPGDHMIISDICYAGVSEFVHQMLTHWGVEVSAVNLSQPDALLAAIRPNTRLVHAETPCNPLLRLTDLRQLSLLLKPLNILLSVDSTFATPVITKPVTLGADLVIHSLTKFINGHGDAMGGCVTGRRELVNKIRANSGVYLGSAISAYNAWLIMRGIDTLYPRMKTICDSALQIAQQLETLPRVTKVLYPGLESHPQYSLAREQMALPGGIIAFQVDDPTLVEQRFANEANQFYYAFSIGHQRSLAVMLKTDEMLNSYCLNDAQMDGYIELAGSGLMRLSIGLESPLDLIAELKQLLR